MGRIADIEKTCEISVSWRHKPYESKKVFFRCVHGDAWSVILLPGHPWWAWAGKFPTSYGPAVVADRDSGELVATA
jgi:hypothetical protein